MRFRLDGSANTLRLALEIGIVVEMDDMNHLMLEGVVDILGEQLVIFARQHDFDAAADILPGAKHPRRIAYPRRRQFTGKVLDVKMMEARV